MIPALWNKSGTTKIGDLTDTIEAMVTEERNGEFELTLTYPATYPYSNDFLEENIIVADGNDTLKAQKFRIYMVKKFMSSQITILARHISFDLAYDYINSINITNQSCEYCLNELFRNSQFSNQYRGYSDIVNAQNYKISKANVLSAIGGTQGSIIDIFGTGAEIKRDNTNIHVLNARGHDNGVTIEYKKNLTGFELEEDNTELATRIQGYAKYTPEGGEEITVETGWIDSPLINNYSHPYCKRIDFSENYQDGTIPTVSTLTALVNKKYNTNKVDIPKINYKIEFIPLSKCGYTDISDQITLCDKVTIIDSRYGVNTQAKVIKVVYDVLRERYESMELGAAKTRLTDVIGGGGEVSQGPPGPPGKDGTSIRILGSYNSYEELIAAHPSGNVNGDAYIIQGDLYVWNGTQFENVGKFQGQDGLDGTDGVNGKDGVSIIWKGTFSSHPANPQNGWAYYNSTDKKSYVYQSGTWYQMSIDGTDGTDGVNGADGLSIVWKGESANPPANPQKNWCYRDTDNGVIYIYNGTAWEVMVLDGNDGANGTNGTDGLSVFITYNDSLTTPAKPTGNGTTGGWHTNATSVVVWMSQKVAANSISGTWGEPIKIKGQDGAQGPPGEAFPDTLPSVPVVTTKIYGFGSIEIAWTFTSKVYYTYEVYASKTNNFTPNTMDLIHEGQTSSFLFQAKPNETWYFKVCCKNSYGKRTAFSTQVSAKTPLITDLSNYVDKMSIGDALIGSLNLERGWVGKLKGNWIDAKQLTVTDGNGKRTLDIDSFGNISMDVTNLKITAKEVSTVEYVNNEVANIEIGTRNLLLNSKLNIINSTSYRIATINTSMSVLPSKKYTIVIKGSVGGAQKLGVWVNNGSNNLGYFKKPTNSDISFMTITTPSIIQDVYKNEISIYNYPSSGATSYPATVEWITMYEGEIKPPLDYVAAPEDLETRVYTAEQKITSTAILNSINEELGKTGQINTVSTVLDKTGFTVKNGAIKIQNKAGQEVLKGDTDGNLQVGGSSTSGKLIVKNTSGDNVIELSKEGLMASNGSIIVKNSPTCSSNTNAILEINGGNIQIFNPDRTEAGSKNTFTDSAYYGAFQSTIETYETYYADIIRESRLFTGSNKVDLYEKKLVDGAYIESTTTLIPGSIKVNGVNAAHSEINSYGTYVKYYDGTQICWLTKWIGTVVCEANAGANVIFIKDEATNNPYFTLPASFVGTVNAEVTVESDGYLQSCIGQRTSTMVQARFWSPYARTASGVCIHVTVIGRWK